MPGVANRAFAICNETLWPGSCPPSPGLAPCAILIWISCPADKYSDDTPKRPLATCLTKEFVLLSGLVKLYLSTISPPSPVLLRPPTRYIPRANSLCDSSEIAPNEMAPDPNRLKIFSMDST